MCCDYIITTWFFPGAGALGSSLLLLEFKTKQSCGCKRQENLPASLLSHHNPEGCSCSSPLLFSNKTRLVGGWRALSCPSGLHKGCDGRWCSQAWPGTSQTPWVWFLSHKNPESRTGLGEFSSPGEIPFQTLHFPCFWNKPLWNISCAILHGLCCCCTAGTGQREPRKGKKIRNWFSGQQFPEWELPGKPRSGDLLSLPEECVTSLGREGLPQELGQTGEPSRAGPGAHQGLSLGLGGPGQTLPESHPGGILLFYF